MIVKDSNNDFRPPIFFAVCFMLGCFVLAYAVTHRPQELSQEEKFYLLVRTVIADTQLRPEETTLTPKQQWDCALTVTRMHNEKFPEHTWVDDSRIRHNMFGLPTEKEEVDATKCANDTMQTIQGLLFTK